MFTTNPRGKIFWSVFVKNYEKLHGSYHKTCNILDVQGVSEVWTIFKSACGIQMSHTTPKKNSMLLQHTYGKIFWKFGGHSFNQSMALLYHMIKGIEGHN